MVFTSLGGLTRYVRATMIEALSMDYIPDRPGQRVDGKKWSSTPRVPETPSSPSSPS